MAAGCLCYAASILMAEILNGAGDNRAPLFISLFAYWGLQIPFAFCFACLFHFGAAGAVATIPVVELLYAFLCALVASRRKWSGWEPKIHPGIAQT